MPPQPCSTTTAGNGPAPEGRWITALAMTGAKGSPDGSDSAAQPASAANDKASTNVKTDRRISFPQLLATYCSGLPALDTHDEQSISASHHRGIPQRGRRLAARRDAGGM